MLVVHDVSFDRGIGTIDIELTNIDINQCDLDGSDEDTGASTGSVDVFRGTHHCLPSTKVSTTLSNSVI